jgi:hypothetical protein
MIGMLARAVRSAGFVFEVVAQNRRVRGHCPGRIDERRQSLILNLDQVDGVGCDVAVFGHNEGDLLTLEQNFPSANTAWTSPASVGIQCNLSGFTSLAVSTALTPGS